MRKLRAGSAAERLIDGMWFECIIKQVAANKTYVVTYPVRFFEPSGKHLSRHDLFGCCVSGLLSLTRVSRLQEGTEEAGVQPHEIRNAQQEQPEEQTATSRDLSSSPPYVRGTTAVETDAVVNALLADVGRAMLVSGHGDGSIRRWAIEGAGEDERSLKQQKLMKEHRGAVSCLQLVGRLLFSGGYDHIIICWEIDKGMPLAILEGHTDCITCMTRAPMPITGTQIHILLPTKPMLDITHPVI